MAKTSWELRLEARKGSGDIGAGEGGGLSGKGVGPLRTKSDISLLGEKEERGKDASGERIL